MYNTPLQADSDRDPKITKVYVRKRRKTCAIHTTVYFHFLSSYFSGTYHNSQASNNLAIS